MEDQNTCQIGGEKATRFCTCAGELTVLCDSCVGVHEEQYMGEIHGYEQMTYLGLVRSLGIEEFLQRKSQVLKASALGRKLQELETRQYQETRRKAQDLAQAYLERLDTLHSSFRGLLEGFHREKLLRLSTEEPQISNFSTALLTSSLTKIPENTALVEQKPAEMLELQVKELGLHMKESIGPNLDYDQFFAEIIKSGLKLPLQIAHPSPPQMHAKQPMPPSSYIYVPFSRGPQLAKWCSGTQELERVSLSRGLNFTHLTVSVLLADGNMISCGGNVPHEHRVAHINTTSGEVTILPEMLKGRGNAGVACVGNCLFAFGGFTPSKEELNNGEKYDLQSRQWSPLRSCMSTARHQFTPFPYQRSIYLAGGWTTATVEVFDIDTEIFTTLPLVLPKAFPTVCLVYNDELVAFQEKRVIRWQLGSNTGECKVSVVHQMVKDSNVSVQILGTKAYWTQESLTECEIQEADLLQWDVFKATGMQTEQGKNCPVS